MKPVNAYKIFPLGEKALVIDFGNEMNREINQRIINVFYFLQQQPLFGMLELVPAFSSLTIFYDLMLIYKKITNGTAFLFMKEEVEKILSRPITANTKKTVLKKIPVCYDDEFGPDLTFISAEKNMAVEKIIELHSSQTYLVYMMGFLPGFSYMGEVKEEIAISRKQKPRQLIETGSVGIAGRQTGVYSLSSPGGWQIIGRTPLVMFDVKKTNPAFLQAGDEVQFFPINRNEFENWKP